MEDTGMLLLATIATASGALVAIVGGLLVSRVVSLATERSGLRHRRDELDARIRHATDRRDELADRLLRWDSAEVITDNVEELAKLPDDPDIERMIREAVVDRTADEIRPYIDNALDRLREIRAELEPYFERGRPSTSLYELRDDGEIDFPPQDWTYYDAVWDQLLDELPKRSDPYGLQALAIPPLDQTGRITRQIRDQADQEARGRLRRDVDDAQHQVEALRVERDQLTAALARVEHPSGIGWGVAVLAYFAAVGIVLPLTLIAALDTIPDWLQWTSIGLFVTAVAALLAYVTLSIRRMSSTPTPTSTSPPTK